MITAYQLIEAHVHLDAIAIERGTSEAVLETLGLTESVTSAYVEAVAANLIERRVDPALEEASSNDEAKLIVKAAVMSGLEQGLIVGMQLSRNLAKDAADE